VQPTIVSDPTQVFGFTARRGGRLFDHDMLSVLQSESNKRAMTFRWRNDKNNISVGLHDFGWICDQF
jgi:hypothetical protein